MLLAHNEANLNDPQLKSIFRVVKSFSAGGWASRREPRPIFIEMEGPARQTAGGGNLNIPDLARIALAILVCPFRPA